MSGHSQTPNLTFGPRQASRLELMGIRFNNDGGDGAGAGGGTYTPPATQADLDRIVQARVARAEEPYKALKGLDVAQILERYNAVKDLDIDDLKSKAAQLATVQASQGADATELQQKVTGAEQRATAAEAEKEKAAGQIGDLELKLLRYETAAAVGIPLAHAPRLVGSTKEELENDAKTFKASLRTGGYDPGQGRTGGGAQEGAQGIAEAEKRFGTQKQQ